MTRDELKHLIVEELSKQCEDTPPNYVGDKESQGETCIDGWFDIGKVADAILARLK